jgi:hypothetical protein
VQLQPLLEVLDGYAVIAQPKWTAWRRKQRLTDATPESFAILFDQVLTFADPYFKS